MPTPSENRSGPSERDRRIYEQIEIEGRGLQHVAAEHGLSPAEVRSIAARTRAHLRLNPDPPRTAAESLRRYVAQLEWMWKAASDAFEASKGDLVTVTITCDERGERRKETRKSRPKTGDQRLLKLADQILRDLQKARAELAALEPKERARAEFDDYSATFLARIEAAIGREEEDDSASQN